MKGIGKAEREEIALEQLKLVKLEQIGDLIGSTVRRGRTAGR